MINIEISGDINHCIHIRAMLSTSYWRTLRFLIKNGKYLISMTFQIDSKAKILEKSGSITK